MSEINNFIAFLDAVRSSNPEFRIKQTAIPIFNDVMMFSELPGLKLIGNFICSESDSSFRLCAIQYEHVFTYSRNSSIAPQIEAKGYWAGIVKTKNYFPHTIIRPEEIADKIAKMFFYGDVIIPNHDAFNKKYFVASDDPPAFIATINDRFIRFITEMDNVFIEFNRKSCYFRIDKLPVSQQQTNVFLETGFKLCRLL